MIKLLLDRVYGFLFLIHCAFLYPFAPQSARRQVFEWNLKPEVYRYMAWKKKNQEKEK